MLFDVKDSDDALVKIISELFERYSLFDKAIVCSFYPIVVYRIKRLNPRIVTGLTWRRKFFSYHDLENKRPRYQRSKQKAFELFDLIYVSALETITPWFLGVDLLLTNNKDISSGFVDRQRSYGRYVAVWTVNDIHEMQWMMNTLNIPILTDYPHLSKQIFANK
ncbi:unnamed protein product, partial [Auanema sp. JU1783]